MLNVALTPRNLPDPGPPPVPEKTLSRWVQFLGSVAAGLALPDAMLKHHISRADIEAAVRSDPAERIRWDEARSAALKRTWSAFDIEDVMGRIAAGTGIAEALAEVGKDFTAFIQLVIADPEMNERYTRALKSRSLVMSEQVLVISDGDGDDTLDNGKGGQIPNQAKVNRDKLRAETRLRLMGAWHTRMFGEKQNTQVNVQVINHAARLEEARDRAKMHAPTPRKSDPAIIDAAFSEAKVEDEFAWLDEGAK